MKFAGLVRKAEEKYIRRCINKNKYFEELLYKYHVKVEDAVLETHILRQWWYHMEVCTVSDIEWLRITLFSHTENTGERFFAWKKASRASRQSIWRFWRRWRILGFKIFFTYNIFLKSLCVHISSLPYVIYTITNFFPLERGLILLWD